MAAERAAAGFQLGFHAIGDRANHMALERLRSRRADRVARQRRRAAERSGQQRSLLASCIQQRPRFASASSTPRSCSPPTSTASPNSASSPPCSPSHLLTDMAWAGDRLGPERAKYAYAWRSMLDHGVTLAFGTDYPVESINPFRGLYSAVTRKNEAGTQTFQPQEKLTIAEALYAYTQASAFAEFREKTKGRLEAGFLADFVVLDRDLIKATPEELLHTRFCAPSLATRRSTPPRTEAARAAETHARPSPAARPCPRLGQHLHAGQGGAGGRLAPALQPPAHGAGDVSALGRQPPQPPRNHPRSNGVRGLSPASSSAAATSFRPSASRAPPPRSPLSSRGSWSSLFRLCAGPRRFARQTAAVRAGAPPLARCWPSPGSFLLTTPAGTQLANSFSTIGAGDLLTLGCALAFAAHLLTLARASKTMNAGRLATLQIGFAALFMLFSLPLEPPALRISRRGSMLRSPITSLLATAAAFTIQSWAQQVLPPTHTVVLLTLEPVFAWLTRCSSWVSGSTVAHSPARA